MSHTGVRSASADVRMGQKGPSGWRCAHHKCHCAARVRTSLIHAVHPGCLCARQGLRHVIQLTDVPARLTQMPATYQAHAARGRKNDSLGTDSRMRAHWGSRAAERAQGADEASPSPRATRSSRGSLLACALTLDLCDAVEAHRPWRMAHGLAFIAEIADHLGATRI